jgi:hypothetical protein
MDGCSIRDGSRVSEPRWRQSRGAYDERHPAQLDKGELDGQPLGREQDEERSGHLKEPIAEHIDPRLGLIDHDRVNRNVEELPGGTVDRIGKSAIPDLCHGDHGEGRLEHKSPRAEDNGQRLHQEPGGLQGFRTVGPVTSRHAARRRRGRCSYKGLGLPSVK